MKIPYGLADFYALRTEGYLYVDRTDRIRTVEELGKALLFLRPRRFGKSLWLRTLACYYDLRHGGDHERLFGDLAAGNAAATALAHRYFVMTWDFSDVDLDPPPRDRASAGASPSRVHRIGEELHGYLNTSLEIFLRRYREYLPETLTLGDDAFHNLTRLLGLLTETPYRLLLLVDEYDNFANEVMTADESVYGELVHADGPFKRLFKWVKAAMAGQGLERLFMTGVSPIVMSDVTSGLNVAENAYLYPELADLCGFTGDEVRGLRHPESSRFPMGLLRRPDARASSLRDLLFEFKRLSLGELGMSGREVKSAERTELARLAPVKAALDVAEAQLATYHRTLGKRRGTGSPGSTLELHGWAVVALGFERLVARPLGGAQASQHR